MRLDFEWDPVKARSNAIKHGVEFEDAASVFRDPQMLSVYDGGHSDHEDRWITLGLTSQGVLLVGDSHVRRSRRLCGHSDDLQPSSHRS